MHGVISLSDAASYDNKTLKKASDIHIISLDPDYVRPDLDLNCLQSLSAY